MITAEEGARRWVKNSLRAYLEGEKDLKWIIGILKAEDKSKEEIIEFLHSLEQCGSAERRNEFRNWLDNQFN